MSLDDNYVHISELLTMNICLCNCSKSMPHIVGGEYYSNKRKVAQPTRYDFVQKVLSLQN